MFSNGNLGATVVKTITDGENVVDVTSWTDYTWAVGNYGTVKSTQTPDLNQSGVYTVDDKAQLLLFPNTATSKSFTYEVTVSNVSRVTDDSGFGIALSNGTNCIKVSCYQWGMVISYGSTKDADTVVFCSSSDALANGNVSGTVMKFVVQSDKITFYKNGAETYVFEKTGVSGAGLSKIHWQTEDAFNASVTSLSNQLSGFFVDGQQIACGIHHGINANSGNVVATYTCSITKN